MKSKVEASGVKGRASTSKGGQPCQSKQSKSAPTLPFFILDFVLQGDPCAFPLFCALELLIPLCLQFKYRSSIQSILMGFFLLLSSIEVSSRQRQDQQYRQEATSIAETFFRGSQKSYFSQPNKHFCKVHLPAVKTRLTDNNQTLPGTGTRLQSLNEIQKNSGLLSQFTSMSDDSSISCSLRSDSDSLGKNDGSLTRLLNDRSEKAYLFFSQSVTCSSLSHENALSSLGGFDSCLQPVAKTIPIQAFSFNDLSMLPLSLFFPFFLLVLT